MKKKCKVKGEKKLALHMINLRADTGFNSYATGH